MMPVGEIATRLLEEARGLPAEERLQLAKQIADSVVDVDGAEWEQAWRIELDRRLAEMRAGAEEEVSPGEAHRRLLSMATR